MFDVVTWELVIWEEVFGDGGVRWVVIVLVLGRWCVGILEVAKELEKVEEV